MNDARARTQRFLRMLGASLLVVGCSASMVRFVGEVRAIHSLCCADFPILEDAAERWRNGGQLYPHPLGEYRPGSGVYKFPPLAALALAGAQEVAAGGVQAGVFVCQMAAYALSLAVLVWLLRRSLDAGAACSLAVVTLGMNFGPFFETLYRLQLEAPILLCLVLSLCCLRQRLPVAAGSLVGLATVLKLYPVHLAAPLALRGRWAATAALATTTAALGGLSLIGVGARDGLRFASEILPFMARERPTDLFDAENVSLHRLLGHRLDLGYDQAWLAGMLAFVTAWLISALVIRRRRHSDDQAALLLFVPVMLMAMPNSWMNYQLLLLPPLGWLVAGGARGRRIELACAALASLILTLSWYESGWISPPAFRLARLHELAPQAWLDIRPAATPLVWLGMLGACARESASETRAGVCA